MDNNYPLSVPLVEYNRLKRIESDYNKNEPKIIYKDKFVRNFSIDIRISDKLLPKVEIKEENDNDQWDKFGQLSRDISTKLYYEIRNNYENFKKVYETNLRNEIEKDFKNLSFFQKLKFLFKK